MANLDRIFHSLTDETRRAVITQLANGPASVGDLAQHHRMALPSFMKHLRILEESKIVVSRKKGRVRTCELRLNALAPAQTWIEKGRRIWTTHHNQLDDFVESLAVGICSVGGGGSPATRRERQPGVLLAETLPRWSVGQRRAGTRRAVVAGVGER